MDSIMQFINSCFRFIDAFAGNLYIFLFLPTFLFAIWAQLNVKLTFNKYSKAANLRGLTGRAAAETVLHENGIYDVRIEHINGSLSDHYDPKTNTIRLSDSVYDSRSIAAVGVAAHEAGHAVQYSHGYFPIKIRSAIIPITQIGSNLALPLVLLGVFLSWGFLAELGVAFFFFAVLFQLITLPVEFNASRRAIKAIEACNLLEEDELRGARRTLKAAAMTYVAALASSLLSFLRLISIARNSRK